MEDSDKGMLRGMRRWVFACGVLVLGTALFLPELTGIQRVYLIQASLIDFGAVWFSRYWTELRKKL